MLIDSNYGDWDGTTSTLVLPDQLTVDTLGPLIKQAKWLELPVTNVDFSYVKKADSAILAILLTWFVQVNQPLKIKNMPDKVRTLVSLYNLEHIIEPV